MHAFQTSMCLSTPIFELAHAQYMKMAGIRQTWPCQVCAGVFPNLYDVVGHSRSSHPDMNAVCCVNGCTYKINKAASWYRHVRHCHLPQYLDRTIFTDPRPVITGEGVASHGEEMMYQNFEEPKEPIMETESTDPDLVIDPAYYDHQDSESSNTEYEDPNLLRDDLIAGMVLNLRDKHRLSQTALDEVITITSVCEHVKAKALMTIEMAASDLNIDTN